MTKHSIFLIISLFFLFCSCGDAQNSPSKDVVKKELKTSFGIIKFDSSITGFKFTTMVGTKLVFSPNGEADLNNENPT